MSSLGEESAQEWGSQSFWGFYVPSFCKHLALLAHFANNSPLNCSELKNPTPFEISCFLRNRISNKSDTRKQNYNQTKLWEWIWIDGTKVHELTIKIFQKKDWSFTGLQITHKNTSYLSVKVFNILLNCSLLAEIFWLGQHPIFSIKSMTISNTEGQSKKIRKSNDIDNKPTRTSS